MTVDLDQMQWFTLFVWLGVLFIFLGLLAGLYVSGRTLRFRLGISWSTHHPHFRRTLRPLLFTAFLAISCVFVFQVSSGESFAVRLSSVLITAAVTWLSADFAWKHVHAWVLRRSAEARDWRLRASAASAELLPLLQRADILQASCRLIRTHLDCTHVFLFMRDGDAFSCSAGVPSQPSSEIRFSAASLLHQELAWGLRFRPLPVFNPVTSLPIRWSLRDGDALASEQSLLNSIDAQLVVPLQFDQLLEGFFVLGPMRTYQPFGPHHAEFADSLATQTAYALAAADRAVPQLQRTAEAAQEQASRRSARATRSHLAPPERFDLPSLDFAAQEWLGHLPGGSAYDIISLPGRSAAFFLAEIPGPCEEASIRLVQLQALLRTRARAYHTDFPELLDSTRRAVALSAATLPPISLFCARYVSTSSRLHYVNAGAYPPAHLRRTPEGAQVVRLLTGDTPLSPHSDARFTEGEVDLLPGDLIAIASAGIPDATNADGKPWGESAFVDALLGWESESAAELVDLTLAAVSSFTGQNPDQPPRILILLRPR
jgi:serine phosphatase RsbU (regulator of sigma subunit)